MSIPHWKPFIAASALYLGIACVAQAQTPASSTSPAGAVATVNGTAITQAEVDAVLRASRQADTPQVRQAIKNQLIARVLIQQAAEKANYGSKPEVQTAMQVAKANAETQLYLKDNVKPEPVTDVQIKARYDEIVASLGKDEYKPRLIVVKDAATAATVLAELKAGKPFDGLARQYSIAPSRDAGGELPWVSFKTPAAEGKTSGLTMCFFSKSKQRCSSASKRPEAGKRGKCRMMRWTPFSACCCVRTRLSAVFQNIGTWTRGTSLIASRSHPIFRPFRGVHCRRHGRERRRRIGSGAAEAAPVRERL